MKNNRIYNIFGLLSMSALLLTTACTDTDDFDASYRGDNENTVSFIIAPEIRTLSTRAGEEDDAAETPAKAFRISDGTNADALIYAVYEVTVDDDNNVTERTLLDYAKWSAENPAKLGKITAGKGQNILSVGKSGFPCYLQFSLNTGKKYQVAFWAQSSETDAFDTKDLTKVEVRYDNAKNNDELRDAFCAISEVINGADKSARTIILRRPLAQVNVGTTGWDYEGAAYLHPSPVSYTISKITMEGVARFYNVLDGKTLSQDDLDQMTDDNTEQATTTAVFEYSPIPAFIHLTETQWNTLGYKPYPNEEFLYVNTDQKEALDAYVGWDEYNEYRRANPSDFSKGYRPDTETFKYLSMSYVLVPEARSYTDEDEINGATYGSVINNVTFEARGLVPPSADDEETPDDAAGADDEAGAEEDNLDYSDYPGLGHIFTIKNVPVQKNWRTNILGNSFFIGGATFRIYIVPDYCGDYNNLDETESEWENVEFEEDESGEWKVKRKEDGTPSGTPNDDADFPEDDDYYPAKPNEETQE